MPCEVCDVLLDTREAMPHVMGHRHFNSAICIVNLKAELAEWRTGKRRVVWRTDLDTGMGDMETHRAKVRYVWKKAGAKVRRVTFGPAGNVRPWVKR